MLEVFDRCIYDSCSLEIRFQRVILVSYFTIQYLAIIMLFSWRSVFQSKKSTNSKEEVGSSKTESPHASTPNAGSTYTGVSTETTQAKQEPGFDGSKEEIPDANVTMAAYWVASVLSVLKVEYAVVGGFALRMRGSARKINHVEFGVNLTRVKLRDFLKKLPDRYCVSTLI